MKKTIFSITAALLAITFAGCSKENSTENSTVDNGKATNMQLSLMFTRAETRATADPNATNEEAAVKTVDVFIYTANGSFSSHKSLSAGDFSTPATVGSADRYTATTQIPTTTGAKRIVVGINLPLHVVVSVTDKPASALLDVVHTMTRTEMTGANGFVMFSTKPVEATFVEDEKSPDNKITVQCERLVAKVTVETKETFENALNGNIVNLRFAVNNFNQKHHLLQGAAPDYKDANWSSGSYNAADFSQAGSADYALVLNGAVISNPSVADYKARYAAENTSEKKRKKEITRVTISAQFIPGTIWSYTSEVLEEVDNSNTSAPQTFYAVTPSVLKGTYYFYSLNDATDFAHDAGVSFDTYTDGVCYWDIFLNKNPQSPHTTAVRWDVLRNDYYKCVINKIVGLGRPTQDIPDEEKDDTPDVDTNISVDVDILFWNTPILSEHILG